ARALALTNTLVHDVAFSPDSELLAASADNGTVKIWEVAGGSWQVRHEFKGGEGNQRVNSLQFSPDGLTLACAGASLRLYDLRSRAVSPPFEGPQNHDPMYIAFSPDGRSLLTTSIVLSDIFLR